MVTSFREMIPWWARIGAKLVLSRLPVRYDLWRRLNIFAHGRMQHPDYALGVFRAHFDNSGLRHGSPFVALEVGPGDSLASAVVARAHGATATYLVDAGSFATLDVDAYRRVAGYLKAAGFEPPDLDRVHDVDEMLRACGASYLSKGLVSFRDVPSASVDFIWSHAVMEHIRREEVPGLAREMRRVLRPGGVCSHQVDLRDHLGGSLNNLRVSSNWWEKEWVARSGFYTNRLRQGEFIKIFEDAGFKTKIVSANYWESSPISRRSLAREFQSLPDEELLVRDFLVVLGPQSGV